MVAWPITPDSYPHLRADGGRVEPQPYPGHDEASNYLYPTYTIHLDDSEIPHPPARYIYHLKNPKRSKYYKKIIEAFNNALERELLIEEEIIDELEEG